jgi:4-hydroxy-2-oxoheptanedioate aldolase
MCALIQAETLEAVKHIEAMAQIDGVDGIFIGPADLSASMGYLGQPRHPEVMKVIVDAIKRIRGAGKAAGFLTPNIDDAKMIIEAGANFCAVGSDSGLLVNATNALVKTFKG